MKLTWKEQVLLMNFRLASEKDKQHIEQLAKALDQRNQLPSKPHLGEISLKELKVKGAKIIVQIAGDNNGKIIIQKGGSHGKQ